MHRRRDELIYLGSAISADFGTELDVIRRINSAAVSKIESKCSYLYTKIKLRLFLLVSFLYYYFREVAHLK